MEWQMNRKALLAKALSTVENKNYGEPVDNFQNIANLWSEYKEIGFTVEDVGIMMMLLKIARIKHDPSEDSWVDIAGYAAITHEASSQIAEGTIKPSR